MLNDYRRLARNRDFLVSLAGRCASRFGDEVALAALGAALNGASVASLAAGGALAAVLAPRQVYLLAGGLGCLVTVALAARSLHWLGSPRRLGNLRRLGALHRLGSPH